MFSSLGPLKNIVKTDVFSLCKGTRLYFGPVAHFWLILAPLEPLFGAFGSPWGTLGASWAPLELQKALLGAPLRPKSHHICIFGMCFGVILMSKGGEEGPELHFAVFWSISGCHQVWKCISNVCMMGLRCTWSVSSLKINALPVHLLRQVSKFVSKT